MIQDYREFKEGLIISCVVYNRIIRRAKLHCEDGEWYICQNEVSGQNCSNKLGFRHSWTVNRHWSDGDTGVSNIEPRDRIEALCEGDIISENGYSKRKCLGTCGEVYHLSEVDMYDRHDYTITMSGIKALGYNLIEE